MRAGRWSGSADLIGAKLIGAVLAGACGLLLSAAPAPTSTGIFQVLGARYAAWTPVPADTTPLALLRRQALDWATASGQLAPLFDEAHAYAELRGVAALPAGGPGADQSSGQSVGVWRAAVYRKNASESVLVLSDDWCAAGLCKARTRFTLLRSGQPDVPLDEARLVPRIADADLLAGPVPECLQGVVLGVEYLPARFGTTLTAMATVPPAVRRDCEASGVEVSLVTRPLQLNWNASERKFVRGW